MTKQRTAGIGSALFVAAGMMLAAGPLATAAAQEMDERWLAWMGCWQPVRTSTSADAPETLLCFRPSADEAGVEMIAVEDGEIASREVVRADGQPREATLEGCSGSRRAVFASRPGRVFMDMDQVCEGGVDRSSSGMFAMISSDSWIDARVVTVGGEKMTWVTRYRLATQSQAEAVGLGEIAADRSMAVRSLRLAASGRYSVGDIIEAQSHVDPEAVEAWIVEHETPLAVDADRLVQLADAGVSEGVIDMMIARSYPERFAVSTGGDGGERPWLGTAGYYDPFYGGYGWGYPYYGRFGYRYGYGYSPFGFGGYSPFGYGYGYGYGYGPTIIRTQPANSGGRVISGRGYSSGTSRIGTRPTGSSRGTASIGTSGGRSSGGSSTGRTARRRGGGGL
ncbi:MAG: hypothetical protein F4Z72_01790 [Gemmatimonadales bacterium]|nr:hypothetical protein [Candidatus Palauibacter irciniicola]MYC17769.1 hypothetical protein [Gemmatimonadales bacterium]